MPPIIPREKYKANFQRENRSTRFRSSVWDFQEQLEKVYNKFADNSKVAGEIEKVNNALNEMYSFKGNDVAEKPEYSEYLETIVHGLPRLLVMKMPNGGTVYDVMIRMNGYGARDRIAADLDALGEVGGYKYDMTAIRQGRVSERDDPEAQKRKEEEARKRQEEEQKRKEEEAKRKELEAEEAKKAEAEENARLNEPDESGVIDEYEAQKYYDGWMNKQVPVQKNGRVVQGHTPDRRAIDILDDAFHIAEFRLDKIEGEERIQQVNDDQNTFNKYKLAFYGWRSGWWPDDLNGREAFRSHVKTAAGLLAFLKTEEGKHLRKIMDESIAANPPDDDWHVSKEEFEDALAYLEKLEKNGIAITAAAETSDSAYVDMARFMQDEYLGRHNDTPDAQKEGAERVPGKSESYLKAFIDMLGDHVKGLSGKADQKDELEKAQALLTAAKELDEAARKTDQKSLAANLAEMSDMCKAFDQALYTYMGTETGKDFCEDYAREWRADKYCSKSDKWKVESWKNYLEFHSEMFCEPGKEASFIAKMLVAHYHLNGSDAAKSTEYSKKLARNEAKALMKDPSFKYLMENDGEAIKALMKQGNYQEVAYHVANPFVLPDTPENRMKMK